jgi:hypothetical protein
MRKIFEKLYTFKIKGSYYDVITHNQGYYFELGCKDRKAVWQRLMMPCDFDELTVTSLLKGWYVPNQS